MPINSPLLVQLILYAAFVLLLPTLYAVLVTRRPGSAFWTAGLTVGTCGCWLILQRENLSPVFTVVISMALVSVALYCFLQTLRRLAGRSAGIGFLVVPVSLMLISQSLLSDNYQYRSILNSIILGVQFLLLVAAVLNDRRSPLCKLRLMLIVAAMMPGVIYILRAVVYLLTTDLPYFTLGNSPFQMVALLSALVFLPVATVAVLLIRPEPPEA